MRSGQRKYLPLFVSKEDTTDYYRNSFSWTVITLNEAAKLVLIMDDVDGIVVNAFTTPFVITKEFLIYRSEKINNYVIPEGTKVSYHRLDTNVESEKLISDVKYFADSNSTYGINKIYVTMIEQSGEISYLIVVDAGINEYENLFQRLNSYILRHGRLQYPIDYCPCTGSIIYELEKNKANMVWNLKK